MAPGRKNYVGKGLSAQNTQNKTMTLSIEIKYGDRGEETISAGMVGRTCLHNNQHGC